MHINLQTSAIRELHANWMIKAHSMMERKTQVLNIGNLRIHLVKLALFEFLPFFNAKLNYTISRPLKR